MVEAAREALAADTAYAVAVGAGSVGTSQNKGTTAGDSSFVGGSVSHVAVGGGRGSDYATAGFMSGGSGGDGLPSDILGFRQHFAGGGGENPRARRKGTCHGLSVPRFHGNGRTFYTKPPRNGIKKHPPRGKARGGRETGRRPFYFFAFLKLSSTATATATVAPTIGLLPMPMRPIISTCAGTELEPANCASECIRPIVSVMP